MPSTSSLFHRFMEQSLAKKPRLKHASHTRTVKKFDSKRCHCGDFIAAADNPQELNPAAWRWCPVCMRRRYCRDNDVCPPHGVSTMTQGFVWSRRSEIALLLLSIGGLFLIFLFDFFDLINLVLITGIISCLADNLLVIGRSPLLREFRKWKMGTLTRALLRTSLIVSAVLFASFNAGGVLLLWVLLLPIVVLYMYRLAYTNMVAFFDNRFKNRVGWHALPLMRADLAPRPHSTQVLNLFSLTEAGLWGILLVGNIYGSLLFVAVVEGLFLAGVSAAFIISTLIRYSHLRTGIGVVNPEVLHAAVVVQAPKCVVHLSNVDGIPQVTDYAYVLGRYTTALHTLIVAREGTEFRALPAADTSALLLPGHNDMEIVHWEDRDALMLYLTIPKKNDHALRLPNFVHVFIDLGVEPVMATAKVYTEIWVVDDARKELYLASGEGFTNAQVRVFPLLGTVHDLLKADQYPSQIVMDELSDLIHGSYARLVAGVQ